MTSTPLLKRTVRRVIRFTATPEQRFEIIADRSNRRPLSLAYLKSGDQLWIVSDGTSPLYDPVLREYRTEKLLSKLTERRS